MHPEKTPLFFGDFRLDRESGDLFRGEARIRLQEKPLQVLLLLVARAGQLVTRDDLRHHLWAADTYVDFDRNLNTAVKKLRIALGDSADQPRYIETTPRRGYRFIAAMSVAAAALGDARDPEPAVGGPLPTPALELPWKPRTLWSALAPGMLAVVLLGMIVTAGDSRLSLPRKQRQCPEPIKLAVMPFQHTGRGAPHTLSAELNEQVPGRLIRASGANLNVLSGRSVQQYACSKKDFREMGRELGVRYVLEGSVRPRQEWDAGHGATLRNGQRLADCVGITRRSVRRSCRRAGAHRRTSSQRGAALPRPGTARSVVVSD